MNKISWLLMLLVVPVFLQAMESDIDFDFSASYYSESAKLSGHEPIFQNSDNNLLSRFVNRTDMMIDIIGQNMFLMACLSGDLRQIKAMLNAGSTIGISVSINDQNDNMHILHVVSAYGKTDVARLLLENGMSDRIDILDGRSMTPLHHALARKHTQTARLLLANGARSLTKDAYGFSVYDYVCLTGDRLLIKQIGQDMCDDDGQNFLHYAARDNDYKLALSLLQQRVVVDKEDKRGLTALHCACVKKDASLVQLLLSFKASLHKLEIDFRRFLLRQGDGNIDIIKLLINATPQRVVGLTNRIMEDLEFLCRNNFHKTINLIIQSDNMIGFLISAHLSEYSSENALQFLDQLISINSTDKYVQILLRNAFIKKRWDILFLLLRKGVRSDQIMNHLSEWLPVLIASNDQELLNTLASESEEMALAIKELQN